METKEYHTIDKSSWGAGPWQSEPDKRQWKDVETGLPCLIVRHSHLGFLCGYVGVPASHPAHGGREQTSVVDEAIGVIEVHGDLTFAGGCGHPEDESDGICHVPGDGESDDVWWFGFDCGHAWDKKPGYDADHPWMKSYDEIYRDFRYVTRQCEALAKQLADLRSSFER